MQPVNPLKDSDCLIATGGDAMHIVLLGPPGAGKGTQAEILSEQLGIPHIASGDLFRYNETDLGLLAKQYMDNGELVPDDVTIAMVGNRLEQRDAENGAILDGFPRTIPQAEALTEMLADMGQSLDGVLNIEVPEEEVVRRLSGRRVCRNCGATYHVDFNPPKEPGICDICGGELYLRDDDRPETVRNRLAVYQEQTTPLVDYYREAGLLHQIDGSGDIDTVNARLLEVIEDEL
jgi:adenylate kinase